MYKYLLIYFINSNDLSDLQIASRWLEYAYSTWASQHQKIKMRQELYGASFKLYKSDSDSNLTDLLMKNPQVKPAVMSTTKAILTKAMEK